MTAGSWTPTQRSPNGNGSSTQPINESGGDGNLLEQNSEKNAFLITTEQGKRIRALIPTGGYAAVDVSQTKAKGLSACLINVSHTGKITFSYFHQPFTQSQDLESESHIEAVVDAWPNELLNAERILIDSPLCFAISLGGRDIDQKANWTNGFGDYLNNEPQHAPTKEIVDAASVEAIAEKQGKRKNQVTWAATKYTWIQLGIALDRHLRTVRHKETGEVYPTAAFNAIHLWKADGLDVTSWFEQEPSDFYLLRNAATPVVQSLRYLERVRASSAQDRTNRFRKLSYWPYPDLWDAFGGAIVCMLDAAGLSETVQSSQKPEEGGIIVPMRLSKIRKRLERGEL
jgi:hypothetical protein